MTRTLTTAWIAIASMVAFSCGSDAPKPATTTPAPEIVAGTTAVAAPGEGGAMRPSASCVDIDAADPVIAEAAAPSAYDRAMLVKLEAVEPLEDTGLHNVYFLSDTMVSGSEPHGEAAFAALKQHGVKTILSVDGKAPDAELARRHGMRYVHVPIGYDGITDVELERITKTFHELEAPFYVHCFHGKHRGPAAAAIGRIAVDGASREQALAEMRQWCGTSKKYPGLYRDVAEKAIPSADDSAKVAFDFPTQHVFKGFRAVMIPMPRANDNLLALAKRGWTVDPDHPDVDFHNEAKILLDLFESDVVAKECETEAEDFRGWIAESIDASRVLERATARIKAGDAGAKAEADAALDRIQQACNACHEAYRNN